MKRPKNHLKPLRPIALALLTLGMALTAASCKPKMTKYGGLEPGKKAPEIRAAGWINGKPPAALRGKVLVVDGWATWCGPCRDSFPELVRLYNKYHPQGVVFIGLTAEGSDEIDRIRQVVSQHGLPWHVGYGAEPTLNDFELIAYPSVWVIGRDGSVLWNRDSQSKEPITDALDRALAAEVKSKSP